MVEWRHRDAENRSWFHDKEEIVPGKAGTGGSSDAVTISGLPHAQKADLGNVAVPTMSLAFAKNNFPLSFS